MYNGPIYTYNCPDGTTVYSLDEFRCSGEYHSESVDIMAGATYTVYDIAEKCKTCQHLYKIGE